MCDVHLITFIYPPEQHGTRSSQLLCNTAVDRKGTATDPVDMKFSAVRQNSTARSHDEL